MTTIDLNLVVAFVKVVEGGSFEGPKLKGTVLSETIVPYTYSVTTGQSSSYMITLTASVLLTDRDGRVLYRHDGYTFHQQYEATSDLGTFVQEDSPAMARLSRDFAQSLVSDMRESF